MMSSALHNDSAAAQAAKDEFAFVQELAADLTGGKLELPSFPDIALRVRKALANDDVMIEQVVKILSAEPALAARLLQLANSAALSPGGRRVTDLRAAMARIGFNMARSATIAFAMSQLRRAESFKNLERPFAELWQSSTRVAAVSYVLARRFTELNPDAAMLAGLLQGVGKLYILSKTPRFPDLLNDPATRSRLMEGWHANIARAVLENWEMADDVVIAVHECEDDDRERSEVPTLTDVLALARLVESLPGDPISLELGLYDSVDAKRLQVDATNCTAVMAESAEQIESLQRALGD
ncbi:MAG: HDOD domain-containing protein [Proteobacteria bacterium]|nr:HDOD domain-containing protein [Pseudomonadota bacterium]